MKKKRWTRSELVFLKKQVRSGMLIGDIRINERSKFAVRYKFYDLGFVLFRWRKSEVTILRRQIKEGKRPEDVDLPGRSRIAKRNKAIRTRIWKTKKVCQKPWILDEVRLLKHLVLDNGYTAKMLVANQYFPGRSIHSISQQMRRMKIRRYKQL